MRPQYFVGLIIGILLLYLGFMGAAGLGFSWTSTNNLPSHSTFTDLTGWAPYQADGGQNPTITDGGVYFKAGTSGADDRSAIRSDALAGMSSSLNPKLTVTISMAVQTWVGTSHFTWQIYSDTWSMVFNVYQSKIQAALPNNQNTEWSHTIDTNPHIYTITIDSTSKTATFYIDSTSVGTASSSNFLAGVPANYLGISLDAWDGLVGRIAYVYIDPGLIVPTQTGGGGQTGTLIVSGPSGVSFSYSGASSGSGTTPFSQSVPTGSYTVTANGYTASPLEVTVSSGGTVTVTLNSGNPTGQTGTLNVNGPSGITFSYSGASSGSGTTPWSGTVTAGSYTITSSVIGYSVPSSVTVPPGGSVTATFTNNGPTPSPFNFNFTAIIDILNNSQLRQVELALGGITTLVGGIIFVLPDSRRYSPPPPRYY